MATFDHALPIGVRPLFPALCVGCELVNPGSEASITVTGGDEGPGLTESVIDAALGSATRRGNVSRTIKVPACPKCKAELERQHFWKTVALYGGALGGVVLLVVCIAEWHSVWLGLVGLGVGVCGPVAWELMHPPAFTITIMGGTINYEFRSERCAKEFMAMNTEAGTKTP